MSNLFTHFYRRNRGLSHSTVLMVFFVSTIILFSLTTISVYAATDTLINGGFVTEWTNPEDAFDWQPFEQGYTRVGVDHIGDWSIRLENDNFDTQSGAFQRVDFQQNVLKPVFISGYVRGRDIQENGDTQFGASLYVEIHMTDGSIAYWNSIANFGTFDWRWIGFNTGSLTHVDKPIDYIFIVPALLNARGSAWFDDIAVTEFNPHQSAVTIMFDDGEDNVYTEAKPVLDSYGFDGSVAIITQETRKEDPDGFLNFVEARELVNSGWDITSHSVTHRDLTTLSLREQFRELHWSKLFLRALKLDTEHFAFPFGAYNGALIGDGQPIYKSMRAFETGDNPEGTFPYDIKVRGVLNTTTLGDVEEWLQKAQSEGRWVVLVFHSIAETGDDAFHTTPDDFKDIIDAVSQSGVDVVTYSEGIDRFAVPRPT